MVAHGVSHGNKNEETQKPRQGRQIVRPMASFPSLYTPPENGLKSCGWRAETKRRELRRRRGVDEIVRENDDSRLSCSW